MSAPEGALSGAMIAEAYVEESLDRGPRVLSGKPAEEALTEAATRSVLNPASPREHGWVQAHTSFAAAWTLRRHPGAAAVHFRALGGRASEYAWISMGSSPSGELRQARRVARRHST